MDQGAMSGDAVMRMMARNSMSENIQKRIDVAIKEIASEAYKIALNQITENREAMDRIVEVILEKETISGDEFRSLLSEFTTIPEENVLAANQIKRTHLNH